MVEKLLGDNAKTIAKPLAAFPVKGKSPYDSVAMVIIRGEPCGKCYEINEAPLLIGRSADCQIQLDQDSVSRRHCQIWRDTGRIMIRDLGSTNKTVVNSIEISEQQLRHGDLVSIGDSVMKFIANEMLAEFHSELYSRTMIDPLTELANRRLFDPALAKEVKTATSIGSHLSLVILDLDYFKRINDEFDHVFGDLVLEGVAQKIGGAVGKGEIAARLGGEEFALLLPGSDSAKAKRRTIELCETVARHRFNHEERQVMVTISAGIATWNNTLRDEKVLLRAADRAMLKAKADGRNCVRLADQGS